MSTAGMFAPFVRLALPAHWKRYLYPGDADQTQAVQARPPRRIGILRKSSEGLGRNPKAWGAEGAFQSRRPIELSATHPHHCQSRRANFNRAVGNPDKTKLIRSLEAHSINTLIELRRIEKQLIANRTPDVTKALTNAWAHYVNSNNLLSELRGLTSSYPFSSECLDEAKWMVISDASSSRSWNYCWLVLQKVKNQYVLLPDSLLFPLLLASWGSPSFIMRARTGSTAPVPAV